MHISVSRDSPFDDYHQPANGSGPFLVGIGASAGGVQALSEFFRHVRADSGLAYVVILHLSPDQDSKLTEILQMVSEVPVHQVRSAVQILTVFS